MREEVVIEEGMYEMGKVFRIGTCKKLSARVVGWKFSGRGKRVYSNHSNSS